MIWTPNYIEFRILTNFNRSFCTKEISTYSQIAIDIRIKLKI